MRSCEDNSGTRSGVMVCVRHVTSILQGGKGTNADCTPSAKD